MFKLFFKIFFIKSKRILKITITQENKLFLFNINTDNIRTKNIIENVNVILLNAHE